CKRIGASRGRGMSKTQHGWGTADASAAQTPEACAGSRAGRRFARTNPRRVMIMREIRNHSAVTLLTTALLAGCGGVHGIPIDETAKKIAETVCTKAWVCCTVDQLKSN